MLTSILIYATVAHSMENIYLIANNPNIGYKEMQRTDRDLVVRFNWCTPPTEKLFDGHTDVLYLANMRWEDAWHGVYNDCSLACHIQPHTKLVLYGGPKELDAARCETAWSNPVSSQTKETCSSLGLSPCPPWGVHSGTSVALQLRRLYPSANIMLLGFTFHEEQKHNKDYHHDGEQEKHLIGAYNLTIIPVL